MAFTGTLIKNGGTLGYNTAFPNGDAPVPAAGEIAIVGTVAHGNRIKIIAGEGVHFGDKGPDLVCMYRIDGMVAGTDLTLVESLTHTTGWMATADKLRYLGGTMKMPIHAVPELPGGVGLAVGDMQEHNRDSGSLFPKMRVDFGRESNSTFTSFYAIWPAANQANQLADHAGGEQVKLIGFQNDNGFSTGGGVKVDNYFGLYSTTGDGSTMSTSGPMCSSNTAGFHAGDSWLWPLSGNGSLGRQIYVDATHQKSNMQTAQFFFTSKHPTNLSHNRVLDSTAGETCNFTDTAPTPAVCEFTNFNNFEFPKNCQGMNVSQNKHFYIGGLYVAAGDDGAAACRVELCDVATPVFQNTGVLDPNHKKLSVCLSHSWADNVLDIEIVEGAFAGEDLTGKHLRIIGNLNTVIVSKQI